MRESAESRSAAVRAVLLRFYPHQYAWGESRALTVSLLLRFTEAAHDSALRNRIYKRTVVCRLRECPARASCACTSLDFHSMDLASHIYMILSRGVSRENTREQPNHRSTTSENHNTGLPHALQRAKTLTSFARPPHDLLHTFPRQLA